MKTEDCKHFQYNRSELYQPPGRIETGFNGAPWSSLDMSNNMFCDSGGDHALPGAQLSALLVSMQRAGGTFGTIFAGFFPDRFCREHDAETIKSESLKQGYREARLFWRLAK